MIAHECPACDGAGEVETAPAPAGRMIRCFVCLGAGAFQIPADEIPTQTCPKCRGFGHADRERHACGRCDGLGKVDHVPTPMPASPFPNFASSLDAYSTQLAAMTKPNKETA